MASAYNEPNEDFFKLLSASDMMRQVMEIVGMVLYDRLRGQKK